MHLQVRPIDDWHGEPATARRRAPFAKGTTYGATLDVLDLELRALGASACVLLLDVSERDCRLDGSIRADARPASPRVALAFDSRHGPLRYQCDTFTEWRANVRAIALALEALRKVDPAAVEDADQLLAHATTFTFPLRPRGLDETADAISVEWRGAHLGRGDDDRWAVCWLGRNLNRDGEWEWEPQSSSREAAFFARCRFPRDEAVERARQCLANRSGT